MLQFIQILFENLDLDFIAMWGFLIIVFEFEVQVPSHIDEYI